jgi:hypothetical protein
MSVKRCLIFAHLPSSTSSLASTAGRTILMTMSGKVTVQVLNINDPSRVMLREYLLFEDRFLP